ncbi:hypothetical protein [Dermacoccus barathri]|uniref:Exo-alpha-sialidase n=1 Tax=Dermacoccus barathri TaxID=322601 RepID=A0ABN2C6Q2_9MICO
MTPPSEQAPRTPARERRVPGWLRRLAPQRSWIAQLAAFGAIGLCLIGAWTIVRDPFAPTGVAQGETVADAQQAQPPAPGGAAEVEGEQTISAVDKKFVLWSVTNAGDDTLFGLGEGDCSGTPCPALVRSTDDGKTWTQMHTFSSADTSAATGATQPRVQPAGALSEVLFTSPSTGYVYGGDLWVTRDGGRTFTHVDHPGSTVLDVVVHDKQTLALTASGCIQGTCSGRLEISRLGGGDTPRLAQTIAAATPTSQIDAADLVVGGDSLIVLAGNEPGSGEAPGAWRLAGDSLAPLNPGSACSGKPFSAIAGNGTNRLVAVCDEAVSAKTTSFTTVTSTDGGGTWQLLGTGNLSLPTQGGISLATSDGEHIVAASGGPRTAADATTRTSDDNPLRVSSDGGRRWSEPSGGDDAPTGGMDDVRTLGQEFLALSRTDGELWRSSDRGGRWTHTSVAGHGG